MAQTSARRSRGCAKREKVDPRRDAGDAASVKTCFQVVNPELHPKIPQTGEDRVRSAPIIDTSQDRVAKLSPQGAPGSSPQPPTHKVLNLSSGPASPPGPLALLPRESWRFLTGSGVRRFALNARGRSPRAL